jgi:predicted transcriptional regulator
MTASIATSYLGNNPIAPERVKDVILSIHEALREVHDNAAGITTGSGIKDLVASTIASNAGFPQAAAAPVQEPASEIHETATAVPKRETQPEPAHQPAAATKTVPAAAKAKQSVATQAEPAEVVEPAKAPRSTRKTAAAEAEAPAPTSYSKQSELELEQHAERQPWAVTELGLEPTYAPRSNPEIARIRKAVFVPEYEGKTGGFVRCLEDGQIRRMLKKHLKFLEISPAEYLAKWGLPADFPLVHPEFSASRANQIKTAGLWEQRRAVRAKRGEAVDFDAPNVKEQQRAEREARRAARAA